MHLKWPYHSEDEIEAVADVLRSGKTNYWSGPNGQAFEKEFAAYHGAANGMSALAVTNGTAALELALYGLDAPDISPVVQDVIVPCRTFMATASAVVTAGFNPVLADVGKNLNVSVRTLEARRTPWTRAVIVVHYAGLPCDMRAIMQWAREHKIFVIEDCAHAHGASVPFGAKHHNINIPVGTWGDVACYSFCVGKIMSTGGEGGMVITANPEMHARMARRRDHGRYQMMGSRDLTEFFWTVTDFGTNMRMTEMQAAIGRIQLRKLDGWVKRRREIAGRYDEILAPWTWPMERAAGESFYMYLTRVRGNRDHILATLLARGIPARLGGCPNIGREDVFKGKAPHCPMADAVGEQILSLPVYPTMTDDDVNLVARNAMEVMETCTT